MNYYIIIGKIESYQKIRKKILYTDINTDRDAEKCNCVKHLSDLDELNDSENNIIVWGPGWFFLHWADKAFFELKKKYPKIKYEFSDGKEGAKHRLILEEQREINKDINRFDIMDLDEWSTI